MKTAITALFAALLSLSLHAQTLMLHKKDAAVWSPAQLIEGHVDTLTASAGVLQVNETAVAFQISNDRSFSVPVTLDEGVNLIFARLDHAGAASYSDTLRLTLRYKPRPEVFAYAAVAGFNATLHAAVLENPGSAALSFVWEQAADNPAFVGIANPHDSVTAIAFAPEAPAGEYYFNLTAITNAQDTVTARTLLTKSPAGLQAFDIVHDHARWIDRAIIYEITPYSFVFNGKFTHITQKLPELAELGVNTIWLQPVYKTRFRGQGYDVIDYFGVREDLGTEADLKTLVEMAHGLGLKVLFDFVPNHTSIHHPYAQDAIRHGELSHYFDFYQRTRDNAPYAMHYNSRRDGAMQFIYYFWNDLVNLNYGHPEVQRMMIEAGRYWIEKFDIDGYRIDAVWGVNARTPEFMQQWRLALKRLKPEILLLGEDKATWPASFEGRFDAAYDWAPEQDWVSHWVWQTNYSETSNPTIFNNSNQSIRSALLRAALTNNGSGYHRDAKILRFMENNDTFRFLPTHDLNRTKMVATMMFSLHGIPLLYNGQEIGARTHPYQTNSIFLASQSIQGLDTQGLFPFYRRLAELRENFSALHSGNFQEISVTPGSFVYAYRRWQDEQNIFAALNMGNAAVNAALTLPVAQLPLDSAKTYYLTDLMNHESISGTPSDLRTVNIALGAFTTRLFILTDTLIATGVSAPLAASEPLQFSLAQNYPNPFNPTTTIAFHLPQSGRVRLRVYDILGKEMDVLLEEEKLAGHHEIQFDGKGFPSGLYFCRLEFDGEMKIGKMLLTK
ncbi:T9SS type A sorting domain-containing protein [bacterium]|nr:T9SS type A sorting domain-containing protein [bacterium]